jgi:hypothetical protein
VEMSDVGQKRRRMMCSGTVIEAKEEGNMADVEDALKFCRKVMTR